MEIEISNRLATLGHPLRLKIFRLLMRRYPDQLSAGEICDVLGIKPSTASNYLSALMGAGLIGQTRAGNSLLYAINMSTCGETFDFLLNDCCRGRPELCQPANLISPEGDTEMPDQKYNVLFICSGNSARSIFAEALLRDLAGDRFNAYSAGTKPKSELNAFAVDVLRQKGHDVAPLHSKNISAFQTDEAPKMDFVFTVCNQAANEECPSWQGQPISGHWGLPDPVKASGTDAEISLAFQGTYGALRNRITAFSALPVAALDRVSLQKAVDDIAKLDV